MALRISLATAAVALAAHAAPAAASPASLVDPLIGTDASAPNFHTGGAGGNTFPGATAPFGMVQLSPDTAPGTGAVGGYSYDDRRIRGFSVKHLSGAGCRAYQDVSLIPTAVPVRRSPARGDFRRLAPAHLASFTHRQETAAPGYYRVRLNPGTRRAIDVRLAATTRTGIARFGYGAGRRPRVLVDAASSSAGAWASAVNVDPARREVYGSVTSGGFCGQRNSYTVHFVVRFNRAPRSFGVWRGAALKPGATSAAARPGRTGAYLSFGRAKGRGLEARIGLSFVSVEQARANLDAESAGHSFAAIRRATRARWNTLLRRVRVRGGSPNLRRLFYTQLYHALLHPSTFSDANGAYPGFDGRVHIANGTEYADFSGWDTYRTQMPLLAMIAPGRASAMVRSLLDAAAQSGFLPKWSLANGHTNVMVGDPAAPLIAGAYAFGARDFDLRAALAALVKGATEYAPGAGGQYFERPGLPAYLQLGYLPQELNTQPPKNSASPDAVWGSAATTLEYALADFAISRLAATACNVPTYAAFASRAGNWRNLFDPASHRPLPRYANGAFKRQPASRGSGFVEGNAAQYTFLVPQDPAGLIAALGGRRRAIARLDRFFGALNAGPRSPHAFLGNEPSLGTPWLYDWLGRPDRATAVVHRALTRLYSDSPGGLPGNDDLGTLSAWWVFGAIGLYPAVPGTDVLALGRPLFAHVAVRLPGGRLRITAPGAASGGRRFVRSLRLNGRGHRAAWLRYAEIAGGAHLRFALGDRRRGRFGTGKRSGPPDLAPPPC